MATVNHDLLETIQMAIKLSKLEQHPVGSIWATMSNDDPADVFGWGWKKLGECRVLQCADDDHPAGTTEEAGLPEIQGGFTVVGDTESSKWVNNTHGSGAFYDISVVSDTQYYAHSVYNNNGDTYKQGFKASKSNPIYGASDTVQMKSIYCNIWQRIK